MKLYHGTSSGHLDSILEHGLRPRGKTQGNWYDSQASIPSCVYLSDALAPYFAAWCQMADGDRGLVVETDSDLLDPGCLLPDEDYVRLALKQQRRAEPRSKAKWLDLLLQNQEHWRASLGSLGTCAHYDTIEPPALTRYVLFERDGTHLGRYDNSVNPIAYRITADKQRRNLRLLFDGVWDTLPGEPMFSHPPGERPTILLPGEPGYDERARAVAAEAEAHWRETVTVVDLRATVGAPGS